MNRRRLLQTGVVAATAAMVGVGGVPAEASAATSRRPREDIPADLISRLPRNQFIRSGPTNRRTVAVTIDDWNYSTTIHEYLRTVLDLGRTHDAHFTFFPIGDALLSWYQEDPRATRSLWRRAPNEGHVIGNHTQTHAELGDLPPHRIHKELVGQHHSLERILGYRYIEHLMRPPGGDGGFEGQPSFHPTLRAVRADGYVMTMWSIDSNAADGSVVTADEDNRFLTKIFDEVTSGSIILVHPTTLSAKGMVRLIHGLHDRHYRIVTVPELFAPWS
jgi:peptidoglycan/xylan/chitin deacetylase (PgdA/CDA1 family)